jgi:hypothetical protein
VKIALLFIAQSLSNLDARRAQGRSDAGQRGYNDYKTEHPDEVEWVEGKRHRRKQDTYQLHEAVGHRDTYQKSRMP